MKILLIGFNIQESVYPLGLAYLYSYAKKYHKDVDITIKEFTFGKRMSYDTNAQIELQVLNYVLTEKPDLVCFGTYIWNSQLIRNLSKALKKVSDIPVAIGGAEVDESFKGCCDFLLMGEGEIKFKELIDQMKEKKQHKKEGPLKNLDEIPFPYKEYLPKNKTFASVRVETSRGCPYGCSFCHYAKKPYKEFSIEYLKENIAFLIENYDFKNLTIIDANFNLKKERMRSILNIISDCAKSYNKKFRLNFELKPELVDKDVINIIKESKINVFCELGLQSVSEKVLKACNRPYEIEKIKKGLELLNKNNIKYKIDMMYGLPKDNFFSFLRTINFIMKYSRQKDIPAHHLMVLNNTDFSRDKSMVRYLEDSSSMVIKTDTQDITDFYKQKLFLDMINSKMRKK